MDRLAGHSPHASKEIVDGLEGGRELQGPGLVFIKTDQLRVVHGTPFLANVRVCYVIGQPPLILRSRGGRVFSVAG